MAKKLEGTVALITGASSGIGSATALNLASQGATVALVARRKERLEVLQRQIVDEGGAALVIEADITDERMAKSAVERTVSEFGRLDTLVNNAGVMLLGPAIEAPLSEWKRMVELNLLGLIYCTHTALPHLLRAAKDSPRRVADLVNISSTAGRIARGGAAVYNATKFSVGGLSEALRQEITKLHVRVSLVEPGFVKTELQTHTRPEVWESIKAVLDDVEPLQAEDVADAVSYIITRPRHIAVNEVLIRPTQQAA